MIKNLLTPGSIPNWQCIAVSLEKTIYAFFYLGPNSLLVIVAQPETNNLQIEPKKVLWVVW